MINIFMYYFQAKPTLTFFYVKRKYIHTFHVGNIHFCLVLMSKENILKRSISHHIYKILAKNVCKSGWGKMDILDIAGAY